MLYMHLVVGSQTGGGEIAFRVISDPVGENWTGTAKNMAKHKNIGEGCTLSAIIKIKL